MNIFQRIASLWQVSPEGQRVERELARKLSMPEEPDYTADLIARRGFNSLNDHQLVDYRYEGEMPFEKRVVDIDPSKTLEKELERARKKVISRAYEHRKALRATEARKAAKEWDNLQAPSAEDNVELSRMADALGSATKTEVKGRAH